MATLASLPQQINLFNPSLLPARQRFSARHLASGVVIAVVGLGAVGWWSTSEMRALRSEMAAQAPVAATRHADAGPTPQQVAGLEQTLRARHALLAARLAARDELLRGVAEHGSGPSGVMRRIADSIPSSAWLTEVRVGGARIDLSGKAFDPGAVDGWLDRLRKSGFLASRPSPTLRLERIEAPAQRAGSAQLAYQFHISAALSSPFAEEAAR